MDASCRISLYNLLDLTLRGWKHGLALSVTQKSCTVVFSAQNIIREPSISPCWHQVQHSWSIWAYYLFKKQCRPVEEKTCSSLAKSKLTKWNRAHLMTLSSLYTALMLYFVNAFASRTMSSLLLKTYNSFWPLNTWNVIFSLETSWMIGYYPRTCCYYWKYNKTFI